MVKVALDHVLPLNRRSGRGELVDLCLDARPTRRLIQMPAAGDAKVQVEAVLRGLRLGHLQQADAGAGPEGIADGRAVVPLVLGTSCSASQDSQVSQPVGGGAGTYPSASDQKLDWAAGSAQSIVIASVRAGSSAGIGTPPSGGFRQNRR